MSQVEPDFRTVLVTRPAHQAAGLMTALKLRGYTPIAAPVLEMHPTDIAIPHGDFDALVFTSANAVSAFAARSERRDIPLFAVGPSTAAAARKAHFEWIIAGDRGAAALAEIMRERLLAGSRVLHPAGRDVAVDLADALDGSGVIVERVVLYEMDRVAALPDAALEALAAGCVAPLYSARSLQALVDLAREGGVSLEKVFAIVTSLEALKAVPDDIFGTLAFAPIQNGDDALIDMLDRLEAVRRDL